MLGAAVTTSSMAVGSRCAWAAANVGAVLTQHCTDARLGSKILERLEGGSSDARPNDWFVGRFSFFDGRRA
jgi:uncharacterized Ntn-hydrolase superfamily protein